MLERSIPEWLRHAPTPGVRGFALLAGTEAIVRGVLISAMPIAMYRAFGDAVLVSKIYFAVGLMSLAAGLMVPWLTVRMPRRWVFTAGAGLFLLGNALGVLGGPLVAGALAAVTVGTVTVFVCHNAYVLDYIARNDLGRNETLRMFYGALAWTVGPVTGVALMQWWAPAPFLASGVAALGLLGLFWWMRLGDGRLIQRARGPAPDPLACLGRFFAQPRLVAGWLFAMMRSVGWWVYVVYLPIFCIQSGLSEKLGGMLLSASNALLFATPLMLRLMQRRSVRWAVRTGFAMAATGFAGAALLAPFPPLAVAALFAGAGFLILLDICGGLPFLMAVKPSERTEMAAVYSSYRDVAGIVTPGAAAVILLMAPLPAVFAATAAGMLGAWALAGRLHPLLGVSAPLRAARRKGLAAPAQ